MRYTPQPDEEYGADENRTYEEEMYGIDVTEFYTNFGASAMRERYYLGFVVKYNDKSVSVYFDGYSELGLMYDNNDEPIPYFEAVESKE